MSHRALAIPVAGQPGPVIQLLDARGAGLDLGGLRAWARRETAQASYCSRSYCYPLALVATHRAPVGVDIERTQPLDQAFAEAICTPEERRGASPQADLTGLWCGKEALAKALGDARRYEPRRLTGPQGWPRGRSGPWQASALAVPSPYQAWACWRADDAVDPSIAARGPRG